MATSLALQLQKLATPQTSILDEKKKKGSLLFDPSEAAGYGKDVYYDIGLSGFEELLRVDGRFSSFKDTLFGKGSKDFQRVIVDKEQNTKLDQEIEEFLLLLSPYLEKQASIKALEWLVYRYLVNRMNRRSLLMCIFPYYESPLFARVLQIIEIVRKTDEWYWLVKAQRSHRLLSKKTIFSRWISSQDFRSFLSEYLLKMLKVHKKEASVKIAISLYVSTIIGGLCLLHDVKEEHLMYIVKMLPTCLLSDHKELVAGTYLILSHLAVNAKLSDDLLQNIVKLIAESNPSGDLEKRCVECLVVLCQHQDIVDFSPDNILLLDSKAIISQNLPDMAKTKSVAPFILAYFRGFVGWLLSDSDGTENWKIDKFLNFMQFIQSLQFSLSDSTKVIRCVLEVWKQNFKPLQDLKSSLKMAEVVGLLEVNYPDGYSQAISEFTATKKSEHKEVIEEMLHSDSGTDGTSIKFIHLVHPEDSVRLAAAEKFANRLSRGLERNKEIVMLNLTYILADDSPEVVVKGLSVKKIEDVLDTSVIIKECKRLIIKSETHGKAWNHVKKLSAKCLAKALSQKHCSDESEMNDAVYVFLPFILCPKSSVDVTIAKAVLKSEYGRSVPFLNAIACDMSVVITDENIERKEYCSRIWQILPKVIHNMSASDSFLWELIRKQLKQENNLMHQFISLVLLYFGLTDEKMDKGLLLKLAHLVMDFSLMSMENFKNVACSTLSMEKEVTYHDFKKYSDEVSSGTIPANFLAICILCAVKTFSLPDECLKTNYWMPDMEGQDLSEGHLLLLLKATKGAFEIEQFGSAGIAIRNRIMACVLKDCLKNTEMQYNFLAMIWAWQSYLPQSDIVDKPLMAWCLNLGSALLDIQEGNLAWMLNSAFPLVPSLMLGITNSSVGVRKGALMVMEKIAAIKGGRLGENNHSLLLEKVLQHSEEILADDRQLLMCLYEFSEADPSRWFHVLQSILGVLTDNVPVHIKMGLLYALSCIQDIAVLRCLLPLARKILLQAESCLRDTKVDVANSYTLYYILLQFSPKTSKILEEKESWNFFVKALTCSKNVMRIMDEWVSPQKILMEQVMTQKFFASIEKENLQASLWSHLIGCVVESEDATIASRLRSGLRKTSLDAKFIVKEIESLNLTTKVTSMRDAQAKRIKQKKTQKEYSIELQNWKKLGLMLETIGVMSSLGHPWLLTKVLCQCLHQTLSMDSVITEAVQQQILSALLHLLQKSKEELGGETSKNVKLNVELIVQCIRSSVSPDTHRRAMLILSLVADIFPDVVLQNMMSIFTFMGTSLLRRDDSYSFQVIHQTIQNIVPVLIKCESGSEELKFKLANVCQVFFDAFPDLPEHRRLPLFIQLASTIGVKENLWILLGLMADSHVMRGNVSETPESTEEVRRSVPHIIEFALMLSSEFSVLHQVNACYKLLEYISKLPEDIDSLVQKQKMGKVKKKPLDIINWETHSTKQYINFKYISIALLSHLLSSEKFVGKVLEGSEGMEEELRDTYQLLLEKTMSYLRTVNDSCERNKDKPSGKVWLSLQRKIVDVLDGIISVLPPNMLLQVVDGLLKSPIPLVRCRATELLCSKLQPSSAFFSKEDLLDLLPFVDILRKVGADDQEPIENRQVGIYALQLLTKHLAPHVKIGAIEPVMSTAVQLVCSRGTPMKVVTQALLLIAEAVGSLKAHAVNHLGSLMPVIARLLVNCDTDSDHLALAAATATHKIIENMAQFLSPHLETLICSICHLCALKDEAFVQESRLGLRLAAMRDSLPQRIEPRLMIPKFAAAYKTLSGEEIPALQPLMIMVETLITKTESKVVVAQKPAFIDLFTQALDLRTQKGDHQSIDAVEAVVCSALAKLLLRLNEHDNIAVFANLQSWASDVMDIKPSRLVTFYRFTNHLAETLKVLFIKAKLADNLFSQAASVLERNNSVNNLNTVFGVGEEAAQKTAVLLKYVLDTLKTIFLHDSVKFTNQERFQMMLHPLINQLENTKIGKETYKDLVTHHLIPCVLKFTSAVGDDSLWKELNRAILLKLRNDDDPLVILAALETFEALIDAFGEDYLQPLLADIMPYITEVFETVDPEIEAATKDIYTKMEAILGDSFRSYLDR